MANEDIIYSVSLDDDEILKALKNIERFTQNTAVAANRSFQKVDKAAKTSGVKIGAVAGIVQTLTNRFINLGQQAVRALSQVATESIDLAKTQVAAEAQLDAAIESTGGAAGLTARELKDLASSLQSVTNFGDELIIGAESILLTFTKISKEVFPEVTERTLDVAVRMKTDLKSAALQLGKALNDPIRGLDGLSRAGVQFSDTQKEQIKTLAESGKLVEAQTLILAELETQVGGSARAAREADKGFSAFGNAIGDLQEKIGLPILETLGEHLENLLSTLDENSDGFNALATAVGELAASAVEIISSGIFDEVSEIDNDTLINLADSIERVNDAFSEFADQLVDPKSDINEFFRTIQILNDALTIHTNQWNKFNDELQRFGTIGSEAASGLKFLGDNILQLLTPATAVSAVFGNISDTLGISNQALADITSTIAENSQTTAQALKEASEAAQNYGDIIGATMGRGGELPIASDDIVDPDLPEDVQKALDKLNDLERDAARTRIDILRKAGQKRVDTEKEFIQKRLDQATKFLQKIDDIERKNAQAITDSATDLRRDEEDAYREFNRSRADLERDSAKERIKIEEDYREEIRKINQNFVDSADEAARQRDAVTFFRLQRERDRAISEAKITRTKRVDESRTEAAEKREELNRSLQEQLEDNRIADGRRLEDLQIRLEREFEAARIAHERDLQETAIAEERKRAELKLSLDRQLAEARIANDRRVSDFKESLDAEVAAQLEAEQRKTQIIREQNEARAALDRRYQSTLDRFQQSGRTSRLGGRQAGGPVGAGQTVTVGEAGPELFQPRLAGNIIPLGPGITSPLAAQNISNVVNNVTNASVNQSMLDPSQQSAMMRAIAANVASETVRSIIGG